MSLVLLRVYVKLTSASSQGKSFFVGMSISSCAQFLRKFLILFGFSVSPILRSYSMNVPVNWSGSSSSLSTALSSGLMRRSSMLRIF